MSDRQYRDQILWKEISLVPQSAMNSLNPVYRVGDQIVEAIRTHSPMAGRQAMARAENLFQAFGVAQHRRGDVDRTLDSSPPMGLLFEGGQKFRWQSVAQVERWNQCGKMLS